MKGRDLVLNRIQCNHCGDIIISRHVHDFVYCSCGKVAVDGGNYYQHLTGSEGDYTNMALYLDDDFEVLRKEVCRGGRGKNNDQPLKWVPICEMSNDWLLNAIEYNNLTGIKNSVHSMLYEKELLYRQKIGTVIEDEPVAEVKVSIPFWKISNIFNKIKNIFK